MKKKDQMILLVILIMAGLLTLWIVKAQANKVDTSACDGLIDSGGPGSDTRSYCYSRLAGEKKDLRICDEIDNPDDKDSLRRSECYGLVAAKKGDKEICDDAGKEIKKDYCYALAGVVRFILLECDRQ